MSVEGSRCEAAFFLPKNEKKQSVKRGEKYLVLS